MQTCVYGVLLGVVLAISAPVFAENRAVEIHITGIGPAVDQAAVHTVRQVIGYAIASGLLDVFLVRGYGIEGGFFACAEASPLTTAGAVQAFVRQLRSIHPDPQTTAYVVKRTASCDLDDTVCTLDAKQCADGSFVGRVPPSCEFAPCPGE
jgi:hypothetical protein